MNDEPAERGGKKSQAPSTPPGEGESKFSRDVKVKAARKLRARQTRGREAQTVWSGLGMIGMVGWGVSVPTLLGAALGIWLDRRFPGTHSWTLTLLFAGLLIGCLNAWRWINKEERATREEQEPKAQGQQERESRQRRHGG
jgi:ATP synthase protein I